MKRATLVIAALVLLFGADQASASLIDFFYSDGSNGATGTLNATDLGFGQYLATGGTLTVTGAAAGLYTLVPGGPAPFLIPGFIVNNVITPSADPILDINGLALFDGGTTYLNIWGINPGSYAFWTFNTGSQQYGLQFTGAALVTANVVPEPGTLLLLGAGLTGLVGTARRRRRRA